MILNYFSNFSYFYIAIKCTFLSKGIQSTILLLTGWRSAIQHMASFLLTYINILTTIELKVWPPFLLWINNIQYRLSTFRLRYLHIFYKSFIRYRQHFDWMGICQPIFYTELIPKKIYLLFSIQILPYLALFLLPYDLYLNYHQLSQIHTRSKSLYSCSWGIFYQENLCPWVLFNPNYILNMQLWNLLFLSSHQPNKYSSILKNIQYWIDVKPPLHDKFES